jgi:drug/metabolite transporter (DMT)-like permease
MAALAFLLGDNLVGVGAVPLGSLMVLAAALSWAFGTVLQKRFPVSMPLGGYTAWMLLLGGVPVFLGTLLLEDVTVLRSVSLPAALGVAYNVFIAFAFAHWAWIKIATSVPVSVFSISMLVIPVIGVLSGVLFLGERPSWTEIAALVCVLAALATVIRPHAR